MGDDLRRLGREGGVTRHRGETGVAKEGRGAQKSATALKGYRPRDGVRINEVMENDPPHDLTTRHECFT